MENTKTLSELLPGESAVIKEVMGEKEMRERFLELGFFPGNRVLCVGESPGKDPKAYEVCGAIIAVRKRDGRSVFLKEEEAQ